jgi:hypothetical protein
VNLALYDPALNSVRAIGLSLEDEEAAMPVLTARKDLFLAVKDEDYLLAKEWLVSLETSCFLAVPQTHPARIGLDTALFRLRELIDGEEQ